MTRRSGNDKKKARMTRKNVKITKECAVTKKNTKKGENENG